MKRFFEASVEEFDTLTNIEYNKINRATSIEELKSIVSFIEKVFTINLSIITEEYKFVKSKTIPSNMIDKEVDSEWSSAEIDFDLVKHFIDHLINNPNQTVNNLFNEQIIQNLSLFLQRFDELISEK